MMNSAILCLLFSCFVATFADEGYWLHFTARSVKSDVFIPLRANKTAVLINECGKKVTEPYGILEQVYKYGSAKQGEKCTWRLHAPANHVVNIISVQFILEDEKTPSRNDDVSVSTISLYDGVDDKKLLTRYYVTPKEKVGYFIQSTSTNQDMVVEIKYHDNKDFDNQKMLINYEFLDVDKMRELLHAYN